MLLNKTAHRVQLPRVLRRKLDAALRAADQGTKDEFTGITGKMTLLLSHICTRTVNHPQGTQIQQEMWDKCDAARVTL